MFEKIRAWMSIRRIWEDVILRIWEDSGWWKGAVMMTLAILLSLGLYAGFDWSVRRIFLIGFVLVMITCTWRSEDPGGIEYARKREKRRRKAEGMLQ